MLTALGVAAVLSLVIDSQIAVWHFMPHSLAVFLYGLQCGMVVTGMMMSSDLQDLRRERDALQVKLK